MYDRPLLHKHPHADGRQFMRRDDFAQETQKSSLKIVNSMERATSGRVRTDTSLEDTGF